MRQDCPDVFKNFNLPFKTFFNPCLDHEMERHDEIEFIWLFKGKIEITCENKTYLLSPDHVFIIYIEQNHKIKSLSDTLSIAFRLKKTYIQELHLYFERLPFYNRIFTIDELTQKYHQVPLILSQLIELMKSPAFALKHRHSLMGYYNMYVYDLYSARLKEKYLDVKKKNYDAYLIRFHTINTYVHENYHRKIKLEDLAQVLKISTHRLSHFIKEILGISFQDYLHAIRLEKALEALKTSNKPIASLCKSCGFSDQKYLNALLKEKFHVTALKYRKIMKDHENFGLEGITYADMLGELSDKLSYFRKHPELKDTFGLSLHLVEGVNDKEKGGYL